MKKLLLYIFALFMAVGSMFAQVSIVGNNGQTISTCSGAFTIGSYQVNTPYQVTVCSNDSLNHHVSLFVSSYSFPAGMTLLIYDGPTTADPLLNTWNSTVTSGTIGAQATAANTSGCLTFVFTSSVAGASLSGTLSCTFQCPYRTVDIINSTPAMIFEDGINYVNLCWDYATGQSDPITLTAQGTYPTNVGYTLNDASVTFNWDWRDGSAVQSGLGLTNVTHVFNQQRGYNMYLTTTDSQGCINNDLEQLRIRVSLSPIWGVTSVVPPTICLGEMTTATINFLDTNFWTNTIVPEVSDCVPLPDGNGVCYNSVLVQNQFDPGQTLNNLSDLIAIHFSLTHSYIGDLTMRIYCPNGQNVLMYNQGGSMNYLTTETEVCSCPASIPVTEYGFSPTATQTINAYVSGSIGLVIPAANYASVNPLTGLIGCPLNGNWNFEVCDNWGADCGINNGWWIEFNNSLYPTPWGYSSQFVVDSWTGATGVQLPSILTNNTITATYTTTSTPNVQSQQPFQIHLLDAMGCSHDTSVNVTVRALTDPTCCIQYYDQGFEITATGSGATYTPGSIYCGNIIDLSAPPLHGPNNTGLWTCANNPTGSWFSSTTNPNATVNIGNNYGQHTFVWQEFYLGQLSCVTEATITIDFGQPHDATIAPINDMCFNANPFVINVVEVGVLSMTGPAGHTASAFNAGTGQFTPTATIAGTYTITNNFPIADYACAEPRTSSQSFTLYEGINVTNVDINCGPNQQTDPQLEVSFDVTTATTSQLMYSYNINGIRYNLAHYDATNPVTGDIYVISDTNNCTSQTINVDLDCSCPWFAGTMMPTGRVIYLCEGASVSDSISHLGNQNIDWWLDQSVPDGVFEFIITKNNPYPAGAIIARTSNLNAINAALLGANFQFGVIYYIHPVAGANQGGHAQIEGAECKSIGTPSQVMWRQNPIIIVSDKDTCGKIIQLNGNAPGAGMYGYWTSDSSFSCVSGSINDPNPTILVENYGIYTFVWNIVNGSCTASDSCEIYFRHPPVPYAGADLVTCTDSAQLIATQLQDQSQISWSCVQGGGPSPIPSTNDTTVAHRGMNYGTYVYRVSEQLEGCLNYDDVVVTYVESPNPIITSSVMPYDTICGYEYELSVSSNSSCGTGTWFAKDPATGNVLNTINFSPDNISKDVIAIVPAFSTLYSDYIFEYVETCTTQGTQCIGSASVQVHFIQIPTPAILGDAIETACDSCVTVNANMTGTIPGTISFWSSNTDGTWSDSTSATTTFCIHDASIYGNSGYAMFGLIWNQVIQDGTVQCVGTQSVKVELYERPQADAGLDQAVCGMYTDLAAAYSIQQSLNYTPCGLWILPAGFQTTQSPGCDFTNNTASVTAPTYGTYNLIWEERNPNWANCSSKDTVTIEFVQIPVANAGPDQSVCNDSATLAAVMGTAQSGTWATLGGGTILQPNNPNTEVAHTPGTVSYIWTAMNQSSLTTTAIEQCHASDTVVVNFYAPTDAIINTDDTLYCGLSFCSVLRAEPLSDNNQYIGTWACNSSSVQFDQSTIHSATNLCLSVTNPGTYEFYWLTNVVNTATGFCEDRDTFRINFVEAPIVNAGMDTSKCGSSIQLRGHTNYEGSTINIITTWVSTEDLIISNPNNLTTNIDCGTFYGEYEIALVADNNSCTSSDTIRVTFRPFPDAGFDIIPPRCFGEPAIFTARNNTLTNYEWHFNPESPSMRTISHQLFNNNGGNYSNYVEWVVDPQDTLRGDSILHFIRLNVLDQYGCNGTYDDTVKEPAGVEVPPLIIPDTCSLAVGRIQFNPTENHSADYRWLDTVYGDFVNPRIYRNLMGNRDYLAERSYLSQSPYPYHQTYVQLFGTAFCKDTVSYNVGMVGELEALAEISPTIDPNSLIVQGDVIFVNNSQYDNVRKRCEWHFGDGIVLNDCDLTVTHQYAMPGEYQPYLVIYNTDRPACRDTSDLLLVLIENQSHLNVPNVFTPNGDGINDYFQVDAESIVEFQGEIRNRWGEKVFEWTDCEAVESGWNGKSAISTDAASGIYYYYIKAKGLDEVEYNLRGFLHLIRGGE